MGNGVSSRKAIRRQSISYDPYKSGETHRRRSAGDLHDVIPAQLLSPSSRDKDIDPRFAQAKLLAEKQLQREAELEVEAMCAFRVPSIVFLRPTHLFA